MWANLMKELERGSFNFGQLFAIQSALSDFNKNTSIGGVLADPTFKGRNEKTDANRDAISGYFLEGMKDGIKSEWIFWNDDDTIFPDGAIGRLLRLDKPFVAGLYFNTNKPYNPIAYMQTDNGGYVPLMDYAPGAVMEVDSVGMGCTLIHRSVYEKIMEEFEVFTRPDMSLLPIHKSLISTTAQGPSLRGLYGSAKTKVIDGVLVQQLGKVNPEGQRRLFPFYCMEYGRTEDMYFTELCAQVGIKPWVDTSIVCDHWKHAARGYEDFRQEFVKREVVKGSPDEAEVPSWAAG